MNVTRCPIDGLLLVEAAVHEDVRGNFSELWRQSVFDAALGQPVRFVQDNWSRSRAGVLRGLHYQLPPQAQGKLVRVLRGAVFDVAVDLRARSPTLGRHVAVELSQANGRMLWVPPGFAHGLLALEDDTEVLYKCSAEHAPALERALRWDDPALGIAWPLAANTQPLLSARDRDAPLLAQAEKFDLGA